MRTDLATFAVGLIGLVIAAALSGVLPSWLVVVAIFGVGIWMVGAESDDSRRRVEEIKQRQLRRGADVRVDRRSR